MSNPISEAATAFAARAAIEHAHTPIELALRLAFAEGALFGVQHLDSNIEAAQAIARAATRSEA
jgi:hypothetical protein